MRTTKTVVVPVTLELDIICRIDDAGDMDRIRVEVAGGDVPQSVIDSNRAVHLGELDVLDWEKIEKEAQELAFFEPYTDQELARAEENTDD